MHELDLTPPPSSEESPHDQLSRWLETGFSKQTVAIYGCSVEEFQECLKSGYLTPHFNSQEDGPYIYYSIAVPQHLDTKKNKEHKLIYDALHDRYESEAQRDFSLFVNERMQLQRAKSYATQHAIEGYFLTELKKLGIDSVVGLPEIYQLANGVLGKDFLGYLDELDQAGQPWSPSTPYDKEVIFDVVSRIARKELVDICRNALARRGVVLCFNSEILQPHQVILEDTDEVQIEDESEINFLTDTPLSLDVISGIIVSSEEEKSELLA